MYLKLLRNPEQGESGNDNGIPAVEAVNVEETAAPAVETPEAINAGFEAAVKEGIEAVAKEAAPEEKAPEEAASEGESKPTPEDDKGPIPYERFKEVNEAKVSLETKLKELEAPASQYQQIATYLQENNMAPEEFEHWVNLGILYKQDPAAFREKFADHWTKVQGFVGEVLPQDLQAAVDEGKLTEEYARELAKSRSQSEFSKQQVQATQAQVAQQQQARLQQEYHNTLNTWIQSKQKLDPSFSPSRSEEQGVFEYFLFRLQNDAPKAGVRDPQALIALAERIYPQARQMFAKKPAQNGKVIRTNSSTGNAGRAQPKSIEEAIALGAQAGGYRR